MTEITLPAIRAWIMEQIPPEARFTPEDARVIQRHRSFLIGLTETLTQGFYDMLYHHPATSTVFVEGERKAREDTLKDWWKKVTHDPIDDRYWDWMTYVGLVHVIRKVRNPMMITAWGFVSAQVIEHARRQLPADDVMELTGTLIRFGQTFTALVAESYIQHYLSAIMEATGTGLPLIERLVETEIRTIMQNTREAVK